MANADDVVMTRRRPRDNRSRPVRPLSGSHGRHDTKGDGDWVVRTVPGSSASKDYRCPGCDQRIRPGTSHVVVWPAAGRLTTGTAVEDRRHWHTPCWERRL